MAGCASRAARAGGGGPAPRRRARDRTARPAGGGGAALRAAQATPPAELRGAGLSSRGLRVVSGLRPAALGLEPEEVGAAEDDQRDPGRDLGGDQSHAACERPAGEARGRSRRAAGQHRHRGADARAERQQPALGCGTGDGPPVAGSGYADLAAPGAAGAIIAGRPRSDGGRSSSPAAGRNGSSSTAS